MKPKFIEMLIKEFRLQRNNLMFSLGVLVLGIIGFEMIEHASELTLAGYSKLDVQTALLFAGLLPVLVGILPAMFGSTAAAAELPMGVLAWQSALPIARWKVVLSKCIVITTASAVVGGIFPLVLRQVVLDKSLIDEAFRYMWCGWLALMCTGIGFFAGSFARDDYQGLLLSLIPAVAVYYGWNFADTFGRVFPLNEEALLTRPWALVLRLLATGAFAIVIVSRRHVRINTRRWLPMAGNLLLLLLASFAFTLWNMNTEADVLSGPKNHSDMNKDLRTKYPDVKVAECREVATVFRGVVKRWLPVSYLDGGRRFVFAEVHQQVRGNFQSPPLPTAITMNSDGELWQMVQGSKQWVAPVARSESGNWFLALSKVQTAYLLGPYGLTLPPSLLPDSMLAGILSSKDFHYFYGGRGWAVETATIRHSPQDIMLNADTSTAFVWKGGAQHVPPRWTAWLVGNYTGFDFFLDSLLPPPDADKTQTTMTAVLHRGKKRGELILAGFMNLQPQAVSPDYRWGRYGTKAGLTYRRVLPWEQAVAFPLLDAEDSRYSWRHYSAEKLDNGTTVSRETFNYNFPYVETATGPATIEVYAIVDKVQVTTTAMALQTLYSITFICSDFGAELVDLNTGARRRVSLKLKDENPVSLTNTTVNTMVLDGALAAEELRPVWDQPSQTVAITAGGLTRFTDLSKIKETGSPQVTISANSEPGFFVGTRKFAHVGAREIWLTKW